jgi:hypothetical protein
MITDLEKENVIRTKRAKRWRKVVFQRSTRTVSPVSRAHRCVLLLGDHRRGGRPEIREAVPLPIPLWKSFPHLLACPFAPIPHGIAHHLSCLAAEGHPNPGVVGFVKHKRPEPIGFQNGGRGILRSGGERSGTHRWKLSSFFLIQVETVVRETPNVRVRPRKLLRS